LRKKVDTIISGLDNLENKSKVKKEKKRRSPPETHDGDQMEEECNGTTNEEDPNVIYTFRIGAAMTCFNEFEEQLEVEINKQIDSKKPSQQWFFRKKKGLPHCLVKKCHGIDDISNEPKVLLLCAYTESIRLDSSEIIPFIDLIKRHKNPDKILYVIFRFGEDAIEATIPDPQDEKKSLVAKDLVYNFHFYPKIGLLDTHSSQTSIGNLFQLIKEN